MRQSEFKYRCDPELGRFTKQHVYGEGVMDVLKNIGAEKFLAKHLRKVAKIAASKAVTAAATKTGEHVGKKAGDKLISMLSKSKTPKKVTFDEPVAKKTGEEIAKILSASKPMTQQEINQRLGLILSDD